MKTLKFLIGILFVCLLGFSSCSVTTCSDDLYYGPRPYPYYRPNIVYDYSYRPFIERRPIIYNRPQPPRPPRRAAPSRHFHPQPPINNRGPRFGGSRK